MTNLASRLLKGSAVVGMVLMLNGTAWAQQSPVQTKMAMPSSSVPVESARKMNPALQTSVSQNDDLVEIFRLIDQIEEKYPQAHGLLGQLRGKLHMQQRRSAQKLVQIQASLMGSVSEERKAARSRGPRAEAKPGEGMYSNCINLKDQALMNALHEITATGRPVDYRTAREHMFFRIDNRGGEVECVYTGRRGRVGNTLPNDRDMNCEHTWPQSLGATGEAKCDLHHLFPTDSKANGIRGSLPFGPVSSASWADGGSKCDGDTFEIRPSHRGNAARAKFYFSMRYGKSIGAEEERVLREWNDADPVDENERARNDSVENVQHNRNPFVDHPEFVDQVSDF